VKTELEITAILHRNVTVTGEDEVVDQLDVQELRGACETPCVRHVFVGRLWVAGRVVVEHDDALRVLAQRKVENVAGAHERGVQRADEHLALRDDVATGVEEQRGEAFLHFPRVLRGEATSGRLQGVERAVRQRCEGTTTKLNRGGESQCVVVREVRCTALNAVDERR
jgi:hypothetical protein